ncbi:hypothetical protein D3C72_666040 [compost metagenome]
MSLYGLVGNSKTMQMSLLGKGAVDGWVMQLHHLLATIADQQLHGMGMVKVTAEDEGIERLHLVSESLLEQKVECPVDGGGLGMGLGLLQLGQQIIGADGIAMGGKQPEHLAPGRGETDPPLVAETFRSL